MRSGGVEPLVLRATLRAGIQATAAVSRSECS